MRLVAILVVLAIVGWLGARQLEGRPAQAPGAARSVVDGARRDIQQGDAESQSALQQRLQQADAP